MAASSESSTSVPSTLLTVSGTGGQITIGPNDGGIETTATIIEAINDSTGTTAIQEVIAIAIAIDIIAESEERERGEKRRELTLHCRIYSLN